MLKECGIEINVDTFPIEFAKPSENSDVLCATPDTPYVFQHLKQATHTTVEKKNPTINACQCG